MEVTIDRDFGWAASPGPRVAHRALNTAAQMTSLPNRGHPRPNGSAMWIKSRCTNVGKSGSTWSGQDPGLFAAEQMIEVRRLLQLEVLKPVDQIWQCPVSNWRRSMPADYLGTELVAFVV
jgi:hypothetical protein